ncbi:hypothetical protein J6590_008620 [Homalodisca vitripennis]|nr:hypothetical protein J6590_008620 [Homalodisca vitripennis]
MEYNRSSMINITLLGHKPDDADQSSCRKRDESRRSPCYRRQGFTWPWIDVMVGASPGDVTNQLGTVQSEVESLLLIPVDSSDWRIGIGEHLK